MLLAFGLLPFTQLESVGAADSTMVIRELTLLRFNHSGAHRNMRRASLSALMPLKLAAERIATKCLRITNSRIVLASCGFDCSLYVLNIDRVPFGSFINPNNKNILQYISI